MAIHRAFTSRAQRRIRLGVDGGRLASVDGNRESTTPIDRFADVLAPYRTGRGSVQFTLDAPPPRELVAQLVRARIEENAERATQRSKR